ncbi:metallophosphoesterase [Vibrio splendidus]
MIRELRHLQLPELRNGSTYIVGDLHGQLEIFKYALNELSFSPMDRLIAVGDVIDRSTRSLETLQYILDEENMLSVEGNHESIAYKGMLDNDLDSRLLWYRHGGEWAKSVDQDVLVQSLLKAREQFPDYLTFDWMGKRILVSHAGVPYYDVETLISRGHEYMTKQLLSSAHLALDDEGEIELYEHRHVKGLDLSFHGHSRMTRPALLGNRIYLDTGACLDAGIDEGVQNYLTIAELSNNGLRFHHFKLNAFCQAGEWLTVDCCDIYESLTELGIQIEK